MLDLKPLALSDKQWIDPIVFSENSLSADYNFGNMFLWDRSYNQLVTRLGDRLIVKPTYDDTHFFAFPIGKGELVPAIEAMRASSP